MPVAAEKLLSPAEYFALEEESKTKHEFHAGEIFAMAGASVRHNRIAGNVYSHLLAVGEKQKCTPYILDLRLWIEERELFTYPDVMLICGEPEFYPGRDDTVTNPQVLVEVLSESTKNYDRGEKFEFYRAIPSLREYILIDQDKVHVERFAKSPKGAWVLAEWNELSATLVLESLDCRIPLAEIYRGVRGEHPERKNG